MGGLLSFSLKAQNLDRDLQLLEKAHEYRSLSFSIDEFLDLNAGPGAFRLEESDMPWTSSFFPLQEGGIAGRWQEASPVLRGKFQTMNFISGRRIDAGETLARIQQLNASQINRLSPLEKYDLLTGDLHFVSTRYEQIHRGAHRVQEKQDQHGTRFVELPPAAWEGHCNGARIAGLLLPEPQKAIEKMTPFGFALRLEIADIKALSMLSHSFVEQIVEIGKATPAHAQQRNSSPPNPAVFDMALRSFLGTHKKAFVMDRDAGPEIWNVAVVAYERKLSPARKLNAQEMAAHPKAQSAVEVNLRVEYVGDTTYKEANSVTRPKVFKGKYSKTQKHRYLLFVDDSQKIMGSQALSEMPDVIWFPSGSGNDATIKFPSGRHMGNPFVKKEIIQEWLQESSENP